LEKRSAYIGALHCAGACCPSRHHRGQHEIDTFLAFFGDDIYEDYTSCN